MISGLVFQERTLIVSFILSRTRSAEREGNVPGHRLCTEPAAPAWATSLRVFIYLGNNNPDQGEAVLLAHAEVFSANLFQKDCQRHEDLIH